MKKFLLFTLLLANSLLAEEKTSSIYFNFEFSGKTEVFIDCNYNNIKTPINHNVYNYNKFVNDVALNKTFNEYCKQGEPFKIDSLENFKKNYKENINGKRTVDIYRSKMYLEAKNENFNTALLNKVNKGLIVIINSFNHSSGVFSMNSIPVYYIEKALLKSQTNLGTMPLENTQTKNLNITEFNFDAQKKELTNIKFDSDFSFNPTVYTNTYKIDNDNECVDGFVKNNNVVDYTKGCKFIIKPIVVEKPKKKNNVKEKNVKVKKETVKNEKK